MYANVLIGIEGGAGGRDAVALARHLAAPGATMTLAHVHRGLLRPSAAVTLGPAAEEAEASARLLEFERDASGLPADVASVAAASPARGLHEEAERRCADLIVVGSSSRGTLGRVLLRDDARASLNGAPCAVAVAARGYSGASAPPRRIGVGYDESLESEAALAAARALAGSSGASVHVLEVVSLPILAYNGLVPVVDDLLDDVCKDTSARLAKLAGVKASVVSGHAGEELAAFSRCLDLLVVGSRAYGPLRRLVLGSTANYLEHRGRCSLLVVPRAAVRAGAPQSAAAEPAVA
jgi:nucleotide-binding universal stress UspA family protein